MDLAKDVEEVKNGLGLRRFNRRSRSAVVSWAPEEGFLTPRDYPSLDSRPSSRDYVTSSSLV